MYLPEVMIARDPQAPASIQLPLDQLAGRVYSILVDQLHQTLVNSSADPTLGV
jgi:hypothetical protein